MSQECRNNILRRDGTSQEQRLVNALLPSYVRVDEREMEDLRSFVENYAAEIKYFNVNNLPDGDWSGFFEKEIDNRQLTEPHYALFLAFLKLFKFAQDDANRITEDHLNFYYRDVLGLKESPPVADQVFLIFHLAKHVNAYELPAGAVLKAGKDALGVNLFYATKDTLAANKAEASLFKALYVAPATSEVPVRLYYSPIANSEDGMGGELTSEDKRWHTFGMPGPAPDTRPLANTGFGVASPLLFLKEGTRIVTITINFHNPTYYGTFLPNEMFSVLFSGEKEWIQGSTTIFSSMFTDAMERRVLEFINNAAGQEDLKKIFGSDVSAVELSKELFNRKQQQQILNIGEILDFVTSYHLTKFIIAGTGAAMPPSVAGNAGQQRLTREVLSSLLKGKYFLGGADFVKLLEDNDLDVHLEENLLKNNKSKRLLSEVTLDKVNELKEKKGKAGMAGLFNIERERQKNLLAENIKELFAQQWSDTFFDWNGSLVLYRYIEQTQKPVVAYNQEVLKDPFITQWPVMKVLFEQEKADVSFPYNLLKELVVKDVNISVYVYGMKDVIVQNDNAVLNASKPFFPFGTAPEEDSVFYIGSQEIFRKKPTYLSVHAEWQGLPDDTSTYYDYYLDGKTGDHGNIRNDWNFKARAEILDKKQWQNISGSDDTLLFKDNDSVVDTIDYTFDSQAFNSIDRQSDLGPLTEYNVNQDRGFIRLRLQNPDFGHKNYGISYATRTLQIATQISFKSPVDDKGNPTFSLDLPKEPYTPKIKQLTLNYNSEITIDFSAGTAGKVKGNGIDQYFLVEATGVAEITDAKEVDNTVTPSVHLLPVYENEGNLYIGISQLVPAQNLSLLFKVAEGTADPRTAKEEVLWSYLSNNEWVSFDKKEVLKDTSQGLLTSGIVTFAVPKTATNNNTLLPSGYHWIRAAVKQNAGAVCDLILIAAQAVTAEFTDKGNDPAHLGTPLPAGTIKKLNESNSAISKIDQPFTSFGGSMQEDGTHFHIRVSERLRHKNRAITLWDYEHIILNAFPSVYKVKCLNHTIYEGVAEGYSEVKPGHISLVIVPDVINKNAIDPLRPLTSKITLEEIRQHLEKIKSPSATLHIQNPMYDEIKVEFKVKFVEGSDEGISLQKLNEAIKRFLSPWAYDEVYKLVFERTIHRSVILTFVENQDYVDYVTCFKMKYKRPGDTDFSDDVEEVEPSTGASVLGSADEHKIIPINAQSPDACDCDENVVVAKASIAKEDLCDCGGKVTVKPVKDGLNHMEIGNDFVV